MNPKKLIRSGIVDKLLPGEVDTITDKVELNKLYALKVREELQEIIDSDHADINEFGDLITVVTSFAEANGFDLFQLNAAVVEKELNKGIFSNLALNNLNPDNPSNKLYFKKKEPPMLIMMSGSHSVADLNRILKEKYMHSQTIHVYPGGEYFERPELPQLSIDKLTISHAIERLDELFPEKPLTISEIIAAPIIEPIYKYSESYNREKPAPSARRDRRKKNRSK